MENVNQNNVTKFPSWPIKEPFNLLTEVLSPWRVEVNKKPATIYLLFFRIFYIFLLEYIFNTTIF